MGAETQMSRQCRGQSKRSHKGSWQDLPLGRQGWGGVVKYDSYFERGWMRECWCRGQKKKWKLGGEDRLDFMHV